MPDFNDPYGHDRKSLGRELFERIIEPPSGDVRDTLYNFVRAAVVAVAGVFLLLLLLSVLFEGAGGIGPAGDFFGGFVNPLLTFLTFAGVLFTVYIQRQDLHETRKETQRQSEFFERQNFESTFFQMINLHNNIVGALEVFDYRDDSIVKGRGCFEIYFARLQGIYNDHSYKYEQDGMQAAVEYAFDRFWDRHRQDLGHYFRYLFNIIRYVDETIIPTNAHSQHELKMRYMKLLRAQLSDYELLMLFYNSVSGTGQRFISYLNKYELLDNIPRSLFIRQSHRTDFANIFINEDPFEK